MGVCVYRIDSIDTIPKGARGCDAHQGSRPTLSALAASQGGDLHREPTIGNTARTRGGGARALGGYAGPRSVRCPSRTLGGLMPSLRIDRKDRVTSAGNVGCPKRLARRRCARARRPAASTSRAHADRLARWFRRPLVRTRRLMRVWGCAWCRSAADRAPCSWRPPSAPPPGSDGPRLRLRSEVNSIPRADAQRAVATYPRRHALCSDRRSPGRRGRISTRPAARHRAPALP
jgi:hypothetical protein